MKPNPVKSFVRFALAALLFLAACSPNDLVEPLAKPADTRAASSTLTAEAAITNGGSVSNLSGARSSQRFDSIAVPSGATNLQIGISGGTGDADLYVRFGSQPTTSSYDCRPYRSGNSETCTFSAPQAGTYFILIRGYSAYSGVTLRASYTAPTTNPDPPAPTGAFDVQFVFGAGVTSSQRSLFEQAATRWEGVITADLANAAVNKAANLCGQSEPAYNGTVDDVVIYANVGPRDGAGGVLASAGPCLVRSGGVTSYGVMNFDSADSSGPDLYETILHEMGHVLGIGTLWTRFGLTNYSSGCPSAPIYTGATARSDWTALGGCGVVPVETGGGGGTACGHWDEETFNTELMTGFSEGSASEPLSRMTVGSLQDMGYGVNKGAANAYSLPACSPSCSQIAPQMDGSLAEREILLEPVGVSLPGGTIQRLPQNR